LPISPLGSLKGGCPKGAIPLLQILMRHVSALAAITLVGALSSAPLVAQAPAPVTTAPAAAALTNKSLPSIPSARQFEHWGQIESLYDDEENSTSISLTLDFNDRQRDAFARPGHGVDKVQMQVGYVFAGKMMTATPEVATLVIKLTRTVEAALDFDKKSVGDMHLVIDGTEPLVFTAPLVQRNAVSSKGGRVRDVQDTYAIIFSMPQYLRIVNGQKVTARMGEQIFDFTGGPLEGMRDVASRIVVTP
jgi:hypothetical protein